jgi:hypothetical protein
MRKRFFPKLPSAKDKGIGFRNTKLIRIGGVTIQKLNTGHISVLRNPDIAHYVLLMRDDGKIRAWECSYSKIMY